MSLTRNSIRDYCNANCSQQMNIKNWITYITTQLQTAGENTFSGDPDK